MEYLMNYDHVRCSCGGVIGVYKPKGEFMCGRCEKIYPQNDIKYDALMRNTRTSWIFPMTFKDPN